MKVILLKDNFLKDENEDDIIYGALLLENDNDENELKKEHSKLLQKFMAEHEDDVLPEDEYINYFVSQLNEKFKFIFISKNDVSDIHI